VPVGGGKKALRKNHHILSGFAKNHIVFIPKYRYQILKGDLGKYVYQSIYTHTERAGCEVIELNVQINHVHLLAKVPSKVSLSNLVGRVKEKTAIQAFQKFPSLRTSNCVKNQTNSMIRTPIFIISDHGISCY